MHGVKLSIITQNHNSHSYIPLSMLSLYSAFKALNELGGFAEGRVILVDSASTDGSCEKLCQLGSKLSKEMSISFECRRLDKDLGNSFAITYGLLLERKRGAKHILNMDNDFVILYSRVVEEIVNLAEKLDLLGVRYHALAPMYTMRSRDKFLERVRLSKEQDLGKTMDLLFNSDKDPGLVAPLISYIDVLDRPITLLPGISWKEFNSIIGELDDLPKFLISAFVPAAFALYNPKSAPMTPYFYIIGDDISTGLEHARRGYLSFVVPKIVGAHFIATAQKASKVRLYFSFRNVILENPSMNSRRMLHKSLWLFYSIFYSIVNVLNLKQTVKQKLVLDELLQLSYHRERLKLETAKYAVLGALHGILENGSIRGRIRGLLSKYIPESGFDYSDYLRLGFTAWSSKSFSFKDLLLYFLSSDKFIKKGVGISILKRRLERK